MRQRKIAQRPEDKGSERCITAGQDISQLTARSTGGEARSIGVHDVHRNSPVDRLYDGCSRLVTVDRAGRPDTRVGRPAGRPTDVFLLSFLNSNSFSG